MNNKRFYEFTKYKKIYSQTYWGNYPYIDVNKIALDSVLDNRNNFIEEFNIKKVKNRSELPARIQKKNIFIYDSNLLILQKHREIYLLDNKKYLILISPYNVSETENEKLLSLGFNKMNKTLWCDTTTYFIIL